MARYFLMYRAYRASNPADRCGRIWTATDRSCIEGSNPSRSIVVRSSPYLSTLESSLEPSANETQGRATCLALDFVAFEWALLAGQTGQRNWRYQAWREHVRPNAGEFTPPWHVRRAI